MSGWIRLIVLTWALSVGACRIDSPEAQLTDYLTRIARVTGVAPALPAAGHLPAYPARRDLTVAIPRHTIDVAEFFELHGCDMGALVGYRNSPLGRLQGASQRLGYEMEWLAAARRCGAGEKEWLTALGADKRSVLPALFWNATFAAEEMRIALGGSGRPASGDLADVLRGLGDSLTLVEAGGDSFAVAELEALLARLRQGSWVGPARRDWSRWRRYLGAAAVMLERAAPKLCLNRLPTPQANRLRNVFLRIYGERIQPELARRMGEHDAWVTEIRRLSGRLAPVQTPAFRRWYAAVLAPDDAVSEWHRTRQVVVAHARAWQQFFAHCNIEPASGLRQD